MNRILCVFKVVRRGDAVTPARLFTISPTLHRSVCASFNLFNFLLLNQSLRFAVVAILKMWAASAAGSGGGRALELLTTDTAAVRISSVTGTDAPAPRSGGREAG